mmetsp:Transcript_57298/g.121594  ORF Transcript_57298/g.121594 Transcript_57298/m.121594 type:complete len:247 (+) Transcript_57298:497-1237(+)
MSFSVVLCEGGFQSQHFPHQYTKRVHISTQTIWHYLNHFWSHVTSCPCQAISVIFIFALTLTGFQFLRKAKVKYFNVASDIESYVCWFYVTVQYSLAMKISHGTRQIVRGDQSIHPQLLQHHLVPPDQALKLSPVPLLVRLPLPHLHFQSVVQSVQNKAVLGMSRLAYRSPYPNYVWVLQRREELGLPGQVDDSVGDLLPPHEVAAYALDGVAGLAVAEAMVLHEAPGGVRVVVVVLVVGLELVIV